MLLLENIYIWIVKISQIFDFDNKKKRNNVFVVLQVAVLELIHHLFGRDRNPKIFCF